MTLRVVIVGRGRVGRGLRRYMNKSDELSVRLVKGSTKTISNADVVVLAVPDAHIEEVALRFAPSGAVLLHCAGRLGPSAFGELSKSRAGLGAMHPLVSFARPGAPPPQMPYAFAVSGDARATAAARRIVRSMGGRVLPPVHGDAYHAAAAMSANGAAALADVAIGIFEGLGVPRRDAARAIGALLHSVAYNVEKLGTPEALTGPVVRGDLVAVRKHQAALRAAPRRAYNLVGRLIVGTAKRAGLPASKAQKVLSALKS